MITCVIIDDEEHCRKLLRTQLETVGIGFTVLAEADTALKGFQIVQKHEPDVVFLDVEMPGHTGFDFLNFFSSINFQVVFTTAHQNYAIKAFEVSAIGYLLKPIDVKALLAVTDKLQRRVFLEQASERLQALETNLTSGEIIRRISIPISNGLRFLNLDEIIYLKAEGAYTNFILKSGEICLVAKKLKTFEHITEHPDFYRAHRSYLINLNYVTRYVKEDGGYIVMSNEDAVSISRDRRDQFLKMI